MPYAFTILPTECLVRVSGSDALVPDEWAATLHLMRADPAYCVGFDIVFDATRLVRVPSAAEVRGWIDRHRAASARLGRCRVAVVVSTSAVYGMMRMAAAFADCAGLLVEPFRSVRDALEALGRDVEPDGERPSRWSRAVGVTPRGMDVTLTAIAGNYTLAVVLDPTGSAEWSVGECELGQIVVAAGTATTVVAAKRAAVAAANRLWRRASDDLTSLEAGA